MGMSPRRLWLLVVDDGSGYGREMAQQIELLSPFPVRAQVASDWLDVVDVATQMAHLDIVLLDCEMPGILVTEAASVIAWVASRSRPWMVAVSDRDDVLDGFKEKGPFFACLLREPKLPQLRELLEQRQRKFPTRDLVSDTVTGPLEP